MGGGGAWPAHRAQPAGLVAAVDDGLGAVSNAVVASWSLAAGGSASWTTNGAANVALAVRAVVASASRAARLVADSATVVVGLVLILHVIVAGRGGALAVCAADAAVAITIFAAGRSGDTAWAFAATAVREDLAAAPLAVLARIVGAHERCRRAEEVCSAIGVDAAVFACLTGSWAIATTIGVGLAPVRDAVYTRCGGAATVVTIEGNAIQVLRARDSGLTPHRARLATVRACFRTILLAVVTRWRFLGWRLLGWRLRAIGSRAQRDLARADVFDIDAAQNLAHAARANLVGVAVLVHLTAAARIRTNRLGVWPCYSVYAGVLFGKVLPKVHAARYELVVCQCASSNGDATGDKYPRPERVAVCAAERAFVACGGLRTVH